MSTYEPVAMADTTEKQASPPNAFKRNVRKVYNPLGFKKAYNFVFFFICVGALVGFSLYNIRSVDVDGHWLKNAPPGEEYHFKKPRYNVVSRLPISSDES